MDNSKNNDFDNSNIFDELTKDIDLENSIIKMKEDSEKDVYDYLYFYSGIFKFINYILLFIIVFSFSYIYIQKSENLYQNTYLDLFCPLFLWDVSDYVSSNWDTCSSIESFKINFQKYVLDTEKNNQFSKIIELLPSVYALENLSKSKETTFLLDKAQTRLKVLTILQEFDKLKNDYYSVDKSKIECRDITIDSRNILKASCSAYSTNWDESILWYDWNEKDKMVSWTSISVANSFLNYIRTTNSNFTLINKQKTFSSENVFGKGFYYYKTDFSLEMKYNWNNLIF